MVTEKARTEYASIVIFEVFVLLIHFYYSNSIYKKKLMNAKDPILTSAMRKRNVLTTLVRTTALVWMDIPAMAHIVKVCMIIVLVLRFYRYIECH